MFRKLRYWHDDKTAVILKLRGYDGTVGMDTVLRAVVRVVHDVHPDWTDAVPDAWIIDREIPTKRIPISTTPALPAVDPHDVFVQAIRFRHTSQLVGSALPLSPDSYGFPHSVLLAFTLELYLKSLLHLIGQPKKARGHKLKRLFLSLDASTRKILTEYYEEELASDPLMPALLAELTRIGKTIAVDIESVLEAGNDEFTNMRYYHEDKAKARGTAGLDNVLRCS